jgi:hypothetical protein
MGPQRMYTYIHHHCVSIFVSVCLILSLCVRVRVCLCMHVLYVCMYVLFCVLLMVSCYAHVFGGPLFDHRKLYLLLFQTAVQFCAIMFIFISTTTDVDASSLPDKITSLNGLPYVYVLKYMYAESIVTVGGEYRLNYS